MYIYIKKKHITATKHVAHVQAVNFITLFEDSIYEYHRKSHSNRKHHIEMPCYYTVPFTGSLRNSRTHAPIINNTETHQVSQ